MPNQRQRKLVAILHADVVDYSWLAGTDEEGTLARVRGLRRELIGPSIATKRGRIVKTAGNGIQVEFASVVDATPEAHCSSLANKPLPEKTRGINKEAPQ